jgi:prophage DNA circulation protein
MSGEWTIQGVASFLPDDAAVSVYFPVLSVKKGGGNRLTKGAIPFRAGVKLDSTGRKERTWNVTILFHNNVTEEGLLESPPLYPDRLLQMEAYCESQTTGTLDLPTERKMRVRCETYERIAELSTRDGEVMTIEFVEDNEDDTTATEPMSAQASASKLIEQAVFDADSEGAWCGGWESLTELAAGLEAALNAPSQYLADVNQKAGRVQHAAERVTKTLSDRTTELGQKLQDPQSALIGLKLLTIVDLSSRAKQEGAGKPSTVTRTWAAPTDIYAIAASLNQDPNTLIKLNPTLRDPGYIPARTPVTVLA